MASKQPHGNKVPKATDILEGLAELIGQAVEAVGEAQALQAAGRPREAMLQLSPVGDRLQEALTLQRAALILHGLR